MREDLEKFEWDTPVVKINYALDRPIPWRSKSLSDAGTVHLGADDDGLLRWTTDMSTGVLPERPCHVVRSDDDRRFDAITRRNRERVGVHATCRGGSSTTPRADKRSPIASLAVLEDHAPGFESALVGQVVQRPSDLFASNANLHGGAVNGGTAQIQQQLIFRPTPGLGRAETPVEGLFPRKFVGASRWRCSRRGRYPTLPGPLWGSTGFSDPYAKR